MFQTFTHTDFIGLGILITAFGSVIVNIINAFKLHSVGQAVDGNTTASNVLIAHLQNKVTERDSQIADQKQVAAVLASTVAPIVAPIIEKPIEQVGQKLDTIAKNTKDTVDALKESKS